MNPAASAVTRRALALLATLVVTAAATGYLGAAPASAAIAPTTTSLALTPAQTTFGPHDALSLTATVRFQAGLGPPASGGVAFSWGTDATVYPNGDVLDTVPLDSSGSATLSTTAGSFSPLPSSGQIWIVATYLPQGLPGVGGSHSSATSIAIGPIVFHGTSTTIQTVPTVIQTAQPVTISAIVAENDGGMLPPSGAVTFLENGLALGVQSLVPGTNNSTATLPTTSFGAGHHVITASYGGDGLNGPSTQTLTFDTPDLPSAFTTITTVTVSPSTIHEGDIVTITAHVNQTGVLTPPPGGNIVTFTANDIPLCQEIGVPQKICHVTLDSNWDASITVGGWSTAAYDIKALYIGSTDATGPMFSPSSGDTPLDVLPPAPRATTSISYNGDTIADYQDNAHLSAVLTTVAGGPLADKPVTLAMGTQSCVAKTDADGNASCAITVSQPTNGYPITATFGGDASNLPASDNSRPIFIVMLEETTLQTSVQGSSGGMTTLKGVLLEDGTAPIAGRSLTLTFGDGSCTETTNDSGIASCGVDTPGGTSATLGGSFAGDGFYLAVDAPDRLITFEGVTNTTYNGATSGTYGQPTTLSAVLTDALGNHLANQPVTLTLGTQNCAPVQTVAGVASCTIMITQPAGTYPISATFPGDGSFTRSSDDAKTFSVATAPTSLTVGTTGPLVAGDQVTLTGTLRSGAVLVPGKTITLSLGTQTCTTYLTDTNGFASCSVSSALGVSAVTETGSFVGDGYFAATPVTTIPVVLKVHTTLTVTGGTADFGDTVTLSAKVVDALGGPVQRKQVTIFVNRQSCNGLTDNFGTATCPITLDQPVGTYAVNASFAAQDIYLSSSATPVPFKVTPEETTLSLSFPDPVRTGSTLTLTAALTEDSGYGVASQVVFLAYGLQICRATTDPNGVATCTVTAPRQSDLVPATATFFSNASYTGSFATKKGLVYGFAPGSGSFVIGDRNAAVNSAVTFWGAQWSKANTLSGGASPSAFKGYAMSPAAPACGANWSTDPGNSASPPAGSLPLYMAVTVTSSTGKRGSEISGNSVHIVIVKTDAGYKNDPGHAGTGTVVATVC